MGFTLVSCHEYGRPSRGSMAEGTLGRPGEADGYVTWGLPSSFSSLGNSQERDAVFAERGRALGQSSGYFILEKSLDEQQPGEQVLLISRVSEALWRFPGTFRAHRNTLKCSSQHKAGVRLLASFFPTRGFIPLVTGFSVLLRPRGAGLQATCRSTGLHREGRGSVTETGGHNV